MYGLSRRVIPPVILSVVLSIQVASSVLGWCVSYPLSLLRMMWSGRHQWLVPSANLRSGVSIFLCSSAERESGRVFLMSFSRLIVSCLYLPWMVWEVKERCVCGVWIPSCGSSMERPPMRAVTWTLHIACGSSVWLSVVRVQVRSLTMTFTDLVMNLWIDWIASSLSIPVQWIWSLLLQLLPCCSSAGWLGSWW